MISIIALILLLALWSLVAVIILRMFARAAECDCQMKGVPRPDQPGTVKRPDRQNSAAGLPESEAVTARRDGPDLDPLDVHSRP
jgi:hypothetical protein